MLIGPHAAPDFLTTRGTRRLPTRRLGGALQLGPHRRAPGRPQAAVGPPRRRRRRPARLEHPRHRVRPGGGGHHRRHAGGAGPRRPQPGRLRLPGRRRRRRAMEARPAGARRPGPPRAPHAGRRRRPGSAANGVAGPGHHPHRAGRPTLLERRRVAGRWTPPIGPGPGRRPARSRPRSRAGCSLGWTPDEGRGRPEVTLRRAGDRFLLVEFGDMVLDLELRLWAHALDDWVRSPTRAPGWSTPPPGSVRCSSRSTAGG